MNNYLIDDQHFLEWVNGSGVDREIVKLNVRSLTGVATYDFLLYSDQLKRRNDGRLNNATLKVNAHLDDGGWGVNAIDPETGEDTLWGQLKPNNPKVTPDGKVRKYEAPPKEPTQAICLKVSYRIGLKIAKKAGLLKKYREQIREQWLMTEGITYKEFLRQKDQLFWKWVKENVEIAIAVVEGVKKAGALLSQGIAAISIPGIWNGCPKDQEGNPVLLPQLQYFAQPGREIVIIFDLDEKLKTQANVIAARERLASCFRNACCKVLFLNWETEEKGIDDAIVANGREWLAKVWQNRSVEPSPIKVTKLEHNLPKWNEQRVCEYLASLYKDILIYEEATKEWYLYQAEISGIWGKISKERLEKKLMLELDALIEKAQTITSQIIKAIKAVKSSNRDQGEKTKIIEQLKQQIPKISDYKFRFVEALGKRLSRVLLVKQMASNSQKGLIPFRNGMLDLETRELLPHKPENYLTWCLPYDYNPLEKCEPIKQWLLEMMGGDESLVKLIRAYLHGVVTGRSDWQRFLELIGPGGTGKSTLIRLAIALIGFENCHITTLSKLETSRFETANIKDKRLVLVTDAEQYAGGVTTLKALTGQDRLPYEVKMKQGTGGFTPDCLVIVAGNENIKTGDYTSGLERRRITVGMNHTIKPKYQRNLIDYRDDGTISGEFAPYIPGLLNWVLEMDRLEARQLVKDSQNLCPGLIRQKIATLMENNPIAAWINENLLFDPTAKTRIGLAKPSKEEGEIFLDSSKLLFANYKAYCVGAGINGLSLNRFVPLLLDFCKHQIGLGIERVKERTGAFILGLKIRDGCDDKPPLVENIFPQTSQTSVGEERKPSDPHSPKTQTSQNQKGEELQPSEPQIPNLQTSQTQKGEERKPNVRTVTATVTAESLVGEERDGCDGLFEQDKVDQCLDLENSSNQKNIIPKAQQLNKSSQSSPSSPFWVSGHDRGGTSVHSSFPFWVSENSSGQKIETVGCSSSPVKVSEDTPQPTNSFKPGQQVKIISDVLGKHLQGAIATVKDFIEEDGLCWLRVNGELEALNINSLEPLL